MISAQAIVQERFPTLEAKPLLGNMLTGVLRRLVHENEFQAFEQQYPHLRGIDFVEQVLEYFDFTYTLSSKDRKKVPSEGRLVIIANHPIGSLDGLALLKMVSEIRADIKVVANELLAHLRPLQSMLLPVNNLERHTAKKNLAAIYQHLNAEGALIIFPAGEVSRFGMTGIKDGKWDNGFLRIASKTESPILPIHIAGRNSALFYTSSMLYKPLSSLLLIKEMFKQRKKNIHLRVGSPIPHQSYKNLPIHGIDKVKLFKKHLYRIGNQKNELFKTQTAIAHPENKQTLKNAIEKSERLGETVDGKQIYLVRYQDDSTVMREIGRLREVAFRMVGEGTGKSRDLDAFDAHYLHLVLWDREALEIAGAYRLADAKRLVESQGISGLYTAGLFSYDEGMNQYLEQGLELGRSFVQPKYWGKRSLEYLWFGIGAFLYKYPNYRYLFGPVSISNQLPAMAKELLVTFYRHYFGAEYALAKSKTPFALSETCNEIFETHFVKDDYSTDFKIVKNLLANLGAQIPTLYKQYTELCEPGGAQFIDFNVDIEFADCVDGLILVDLDKVKSQKRDRYISVHQSRENAA